MRRPVSALTLALVAAACADGAARSFPHLDEVPPLALEEELRIGSLDDPELGFSRIGAVRPAADGGVWVAEVTDREIRAYDAAGRLVRTYGREGDGPGEFRSISDFGLVGDTLWVADGSLRRLTLLHAQDGELLGTVTARIDFPIGAIGPMMRNVTSHPAELRPGGLVVGSVSSAIYPNLPDSVVEVPRLVFDRGGNVIDTLEMVSVRVSRPAMEVRIGSSTRFVYLSPPPQDSGSLGIDLEDGRIEAGWAVDPGAATGTLTVRRISTAGDTTTRSDLAYTPRPVPAHYADSMAAERASVGRPSPSDSLEIFRAYRSTMEMPPHFQPVVTPRPGEEGGAWFRLWEPGSDRLRHLVVGDDGAVRGIAELASGASVQWAGSDHVWVVERDAFDVQWLVRYRLRPADAPDS